MNDFAVSSGLDPADLPAVASLLAAGLEQAWDEPSLAQIAALPNSFIVLARPTEIAGAAVGAALCRVAAGECELLALAVRPGCAGQGVGAALVQACLDRAAQAGAARMVLEVADDNLAARRLYARFGLTDVGRRRHYYRRGDGARCDAVIMARRLPDAAKP
ncbi:MAG: GNAT family N-acetyltransferase [Alphaproteobacteria bacterium]